MDEQDRLARDLADTLVDTQDTSVTKKQLAAMQSWDVYEWLEAWGFFYEFGEWKQAAKED